MATLKYRLNRKNASGTYDTIHYETSSNIVMRPSGRTVEQDLADFLPRSQDTDDVPQSLTVAQISVANSKVFCKLGNGTVRDLTLDTNTVYTHPSAIQCNASSEIESLKSSVSSGKQQVANAITGKGVSASQNDSFATLANKISQIQSLTSIDSTMRSMTRPTGSNKWCTFDYVKIDDLNLWYGNSVEYYFQGVESSGIGNWDIHYGQLWWSNHNRTFPCKFMASYSASTLSGSVRASNEAPSSSDIPVKTISATTYNGHPAVDVTLTVENKIHWWSFGGVSETARVIVYCTSWSDTIAIKGTAVGTVNYST